MSSHSKKNKQNSKRQETGELRIIGGQWKRTKLTFPVIEGVRPTPSRVRETLFNWLANEIHGSLCIDLFAGSGVLGLEALSRGAEKAVFVDKAPAICSSINQHVQRLEANAEVIQGDALDICGLVNQIDFSPDIIFCDPPFNKHIVPDLITDLASAIWLKTPTLIYLETEVDISELTTPPSWQLLREKTAGDVAYRLYLSP